MIKQFVHFVLSALLLLGSVIEGQAKPRTDLLSIPTLGNGGLDEETFRSEGIHVPGIDFLMDIGLVPDGEKPKIPKFSERFARGKKEFGLQLGYGFTFNLPPVTTVENDRTNIKFIYFFPNFKYNLTGIVGKSFYQGALYWVVDGGVAISIQDPDRLGRKVDDAPNYVFGITPFQLEYKFVKANRKWGPYIFGGAGFSIGDWHKGADEISTAFEFILQTGGGIEYFLDNGQSMYFNYRFWHLSNSNIKSPNIGLNAHVFSIGFSF